jgi:hypothetical protein
MNIGEYTSFWSGVMKSDRERAGVAIVIKRSLISRIVNFDFCNKRLVALTMKLYGREVCLMAAYTPMHDALTSGESFFEAMTSELNKVTVGAFLLYVACGTSLLRVQQ